MRGPIRPASAISPPATARYGNDPVRTASLAYDAVALVAALVKTQGKQRFSEQVLTNSSGFTGIDGLFRFRPDGTNQRGLTVLRVTPTGGQIISPPPKAFGGGPEQNHPLTSSAHLRFRRCGTWNKSASCSLLNGAAMNLPATASAIAASRPEMR